MRYISVLILECPMTKTQSREGTEARYRNWSEFFSTAFHVKTTENEVKFLWSSTCKQFRKGQGREPHVETLRLIWEVWSIKEY